MRNVGSKYNLLKIAKIDTVSYELSLIGNGIEKDTLFMLITHKGKIAPNMNTIQIKSVKHGQCGAGPEETLLPDTITKLKSILPLKNKYILLSAHRV